MLYASSHLLSSVPFPPFLFSSFSTYTLIFPCILPLSTNPTCLAFLRPFDIQIHAMDSRSKLHYDNSHSSPLLSAHLSDFLYKRRSPHFRPSLCFRPQAVSLLASPSAPHTLMCIPAYTIEKHTRINHEQSLLYPPLSFPSSISSTGDPKQVIYRSGNLKSFYANHLIY